MFNRHGPEVDMESFEKIISYLCADPNRTITLPVDSRDLPEGKPKILATPCGCGGVLRYGPWPLKTSVNGEECYFPAVHYYSCSNCDHKLLTPEISNEIKKRITAARQKIVESGLLIGNKNV